MRAAWGKTMTFGLQPVYLTVEVLNSGKAAILL